MCSKSRDVEGTIAQRLRALFAASVKALDAGPLVQRELQARPITSEAITLLALGKAAVPMASAAVEVLSDKLCSVSVVAPNIPGGMPAGWMASSHPTPSQRSVAAAEALLAAAKQAKGEVLFLLSGGGSALAALPAPGLSLDDKVSLLNELFRSGVTIDELNVVRKHLSGIKGGQLAQATSVPVTTLLVSDVVGDRLHTIASGPSLPDPSTFQDALDIVSAVGGITDGPAMHRLREGAAGKIVETPSVARDGDRTVLLAGFGALASKAQRLAEADGFASCLLPRDLEGSIESVAATLLQETRNPGLWIAGAESTVKLANSPGRGGRAQHLALHLALAIRGPEAAYVLVAGSDGVDGNSDAAGALVDNQTCDRMLAIGIDPEESLRKFDSATALASVGAQIVTGPTGVNHADLIFVYRPH
jgi:hydroxypyruvate reductase